MQGENKHIWVELCSEAAICEDPARFEELATQIDEVLRKEQQRLGAGRLPKSSGSVGAPHKNKPFAVPTNKQRA